MEIYNIWIFLQLGWIAVSIYWFWKRYDLVPLLISGFMFYVISFRFWVLSMGFVTPVDITPFGFRIPSTEEYEVALRLAVIGQSIFLICYFLTQRARIVFAGTEMEPSSIGWLRRKVVAIVLICLPAVIVLRGAVMAQAAAGKSLGFEISNYASLFPFVLVSIVVLLSLLWKAGGLSTPLQKLLAVLTFVIVAVLTFGPSSRFQFLGWFVASTVILMAGKTPLRQTVTLTVGIALASTAFGVAGAMRGADMESDLQEDAFERVAFAEDANMLDGFALLLQVYPDRLNYTYGEGHLEILLRPIPRAWWPGKPVGGYMNKLGIFDAKSRFGLGISQSLFGSFYEEGGEIAIAILSIIYGLIIGRFVCFTTRVHPFAGLLMRAMLCAFLVPLLRGGDLPGMYAWAGMAFWPCLLILWLRRHEWLTRRPPRTWDRYVGAQNI